ncbi:MAG: FHA domain-containing protein [Anaerolineaceae bacterium]|nr:FHA domain-containing protein [Anaerolineaceae bacterium]
MIYKNNNRSPKRWRTSLILIIMVGLFVVPAVQAQEESQSRANIQEISTDNFPQISFFLEAYDESGQTLNDLSEADIAIMENEQEPIPIDLLQRSEPGYQVILAYNFSPTLAVNTSGGLSRYQVISDHIIQWLDSRPANTPDDFSLVTDTGLQQIRDENPREFAQRLAGYQPDLMNSQPNLTSLLQALDLATDPTINPLMKRAILYITPQPTITNVSAFPGFIERAVQQNVPVYVWMVGPVSARSSNPSVVDPLVNLAEGTGGQFFLYSGQEDLPDIEEYFRANRYIYEVTYTSGIRSSGTHRLKAVIQQNGSSIVSETTNVSLTVEAPNPILINPPLLVSRDWVVDARDARIRDLEPDQVEIEFMYEFLDGHPRELVSARLYVQGEVVQERTQAPFDTFRLDLTPYETDQEILFFVEIEDNLGIKARTQPAVIELTVAPIPLTFWEGLLRLELTPERWIILASVLIAGAVLLTAIILVGKRQAFWREQAAKRQRKIDPVTQPVKIKQADERSGNGNPGRTFISKQVEAMLIPLNERYQPNRKKTVVLDRKEWIIGCDPIQARLVVANAALDDVHARLSRTEQGEYWLRDQNSIAGTWVNFAPITTKGVKLRHGDLIHFAKALYRFELSHPTEDREIQIITYNQNYDS